MSDPSAQWICNASQSGQPGLTFLDLAAWGGCARHGFVCQRPVTRPMSSTSFSSPPFLPPGNIVCQQEINYLARRSINLFSSFSNKFLNPTAQPRLVPTRFKNTWRIWSEASEAGSNRAFEPHKTDTAVARILSWDDRKSSGWVAQKGRSFRIIFKGKQLFPCLRGTPRRWLGGT